MFDVLFGWKRAHNCKKLIKKFQCRLKILKKKRTVIINQSREDIALLLKQTHHHSALNRLEQLYKDENVISVYEMLDQYSEFILLHLSYIRRCRDLPNDINEAISTLIYASARCGDLPELCLLRELFEDRYGHRFSNMAVQFLPGNLVSLQAKDKLNPQPATQIAKNKLLHEIVEDYFFKPGQLSLEYTPEVHAQPQKIMKQLSSPIVEIPRKEIVKQKREEIENGGYKPVVYFDDVEEFKSSTKKDMVLIDQDQSYFVFKYGFMNNSNGESYSNEDENNKDIVVYDVFREEIEDMGMVSSKIMEMELWVKEIYETNSPPHVHPKLPYYDEIEAKFKDLKKVYQLNNV